MATAMISVDMFELWKSHRLRVGGIFVCKTNSLLCFLQFLSILFSVESLWVLGAIGSRV